MNFDDVILQEVKQALISDSSFSFKQAGNNLRQGICPNCGERECFVNLENPWRVSCGRLNNCQWSATIRELYPEIFENISRRHPATESNPNATADAYLSEIRGFDLAKINGMYFQANAKHQKKEEYYPAVKVIISQTCYWLRIINAEDVRKNGAKSKIVGDYRYEGWIPPKMEFKENDEIWITEGIFKSMAFLHIGKKSISGLSASNFPLNIVKANVGKKITWVIAEDNDPAGIKATKKFIELLKNLGETYRVAFTQTGEDWDDAFRDGRLNEKYIQDSYFRGFFFLAESPEVKAFYHWCKYKRFHHVFDLNNELFSYKIDEKDAPMNVRETIVYPDPATGWNVSNKKREEFFSNFRSFTKIKKICNALPRFVFQETDIVTGKTSVYFFIKHANNIPSKLMNTTGDSTITAKGFSTLIAREAGMVKFRGAETDLDILFDQWTKGFIKIVQGVPFIGYDKDHKVYVFKDFAYCNGQYQKMNEHGFASFDRLSVKCNLKTCAQLIDPSPEKFNPDWLPDYYQAFGMNGMILLSWWLGTLFAEQTRARFRYWPFLECSGAPGTGKSTQIQFLWKCLGVRGPEGFDPNKTSVAGMAREIGKLANLPSVLLEGDRQESTQRKQKCFDFNHLKNNYEGGLLRTVGTSGGTNDTEQIFFRGGILIAQNAEINGEEAALERLIHCHYEKLTFSSESRRIVRRLESLDAHDLGGFLHNVLGRENQLFDGFSRAFPEMVEHYNSLQQQQGGCDKLRLRENHAMIAAWAKQLPLIFGNYITEKQVEETVNELWNRAKKLFVRTSGDDPILGRFWDAFDYLNTLRYERDNYDTCGYPVELNHSAKPNEFIAFNLPEVQRVANTFRIPLPDSDLLVERFKIGRKRICVGFKAIHSALTKKTIKCWIFKRNENEEIPEKV